MNIFKKLFKGLKSLVSGITGHKEASQAASQANQYADEARAARTALEEKTKKERLRAQKLAIRGIRSRRAAAHYNPATGASPSYGSMTIG